MNNLRNLALWIVVALLLVFLFNLFQGSGQHPAASNITYSRFRQEVISGDVKNGTVVGPAGVGLVFQGGTLDGVTYQGNIDLSASGATGKSHPGPTARQRAESWT